MEFVRGLGGADPQPFYDLVVQKVAALGLPSVSFEWSESTILAGKTGLFKKSSVESEQAKELRVLFHEISEFIILVYPFAGHLLTEAWRGRRGEPDAHPSGDLWDMQESLFFELVAEAAGEAFDEFMEEQGVTDAPSPKDVFGEK